jgi:hypothetical protein
MTDNLPGASTMLEAKKPAIRRNQEKPEGCRLASCSEQAKEGASPAKSYTFPVKPPELAPGVVPAGVTAPVMSMDANPYQFAAQQFPGGGFPGFAYLSQLATRPNSGKWLPRWHGVDPGMAGIHQQARRRHGQRRKNQID